MKSSALFLTLVLLAPTSWASGPLTTSLEGVPVSWKVGTTITYNAEAGGLKPEGGYDQAKTLGMIKSAFSTWTNVPGINLDVQQGPFLNNGGPVNSSNFQQFLMMGKKECYPEVYGGDGSGCFNPIVWDSDGSIIESMFGECSQFNIIGFAGMDTLGGYPTTQRGKAIFNGACIAPVVSKNGCKPCATLTDAQIETVMTHELGHFLGMGHSQLNPLAFQKCTEQAGGCPSEFQSSLPTMFPMAVVNAQMDSLHEDDAAYFERLYGSNGNTCSVSGNVFQTDGTTGLAGVEVIAKNSNSDVIAAVTGAESPKNDKKVCISNCGAYTIHGLKPNTSYQLCVQKISPQFQGVSSIVSNAPAASQSITDTCPSGLTVQCQCSNGSCTQFTGKNITVGQAGSSPWTSGGSSTASTNQSAAQNGGVPTGATGGGASGGCSLIRD